MVQLFGILNITPDSFSDGGKFLEPEKALAQAQTLVDEGADFLDVGAQSTKPGAEDVTFAEEWGRLEPVLKPLLDAFPGKISLDTMKPEIAEMFLQLGGTILNDVRGFQDPAMVEVAAQLTSMSSQRRLGSSKNEKIFNDWIPDQVRNDSFIIVNHFPGRTVEEVHEQKISSINRVVNDLLVKKVQLINLGINPEIIVLDPGIGFGKTMELNEQLLEFAKYVPGEKVLIGHSRKRFLGEQRFETEPNVKAGKIAVAAGAQFLRVHEVDIYQNLK